MIIIAKRLSLLFLLYILPLHALAQKPVNQIITIKGVVVDQKNSHPLAYVSVGILNKPIGTVADTTGQFMFSVGPENLTDTIKLSLVGYTPLKIILKDYMAGAGQPVKLSEKTEQLSEVTITNVTGSINAEIVGREAVSKAVQVSIHNKKTADETIGSEMGMLYHPTRRNGLIRDFNFYISANNFNFIKFRINIYAVKNGLPDTLISNKQIFTTVDNFKTGWCKINLEPWHIRVSGDFIVTVQWIESRMDKKEKPVTILPVTLTLFSKNCYVRIASQDKWKKMGVNLSSYATLVD